MESKLFDGNGYLLAEWRHLIDKYGVSTSVMKQLLDLTNGRVEVMALEHVLTWTVRDAILDKLMEGV